MAVTDEERKLFEKKMMEEARNKFLANPYKHTPIEVEHGKRKEVRIWETNI